MEGTRGGRDSARKIFEMGFRSEQRNARLHSEGRVQEEKTESESGKESGKVWGRMEGKSAGYGRNAGEKRKRIRKRRRERSTTRGTGMPVKKLKN
jgi:hypothetical protein